MVLYVGGISITEFCVWFGEGSAGPPSSCNRRYTPEFSAGKLSLLNTGRWDLSESLVGGVMPGGSCTSRFSLALNSAIRYLRTKDGDCCVPNGAFTISVAILFFFVLEIVVLTYQSPSEMVKIDRTTPSNIETMTLIPIFWGDCAWVDCAWVDWDWVDWSWVDWTWVDSDWTWVE